jgi:hypothetical protein
MLLLKEIFMRTIKLKALVVYLTGSPQALRGIIKISSEKS